jgi:hypothetical protein
MGSVSPRATARRAPRRWHAPLAGIALVASAGLAHAGGATRKVEVKTDPPGAKVYLDDVDAGAVCEATPCTIDAPVGQTPIIIRLDNYDPVIDALDVPRRRSRKPIVVKYTLHSAVGTLVIDSPEAAGATVVVDEEDKGTVPVRVDVSAEAHHVVVEKDGQKLYDDYITVATGQELPIKPKAPEVADAGGSGDGDGDGDGDGGDGGGSGSGGDDGDLGVHTKAPEAPRRRVIAVGGALDVGFRHFEYTPSSEADLPRREDEGGQVMAGPMIELWPAELFHLHHLRGLSLFGRIEFGLNHQAVVDQMNQPIGPSTFWGSFEASVRYKWVIHDLVGIEANVGYTRDQLQFNAASTAQLSMLPVADYRSIEVGGRATLVLGGFEPYLSFENRIVLSGGELETRFLTASASGVRGAIGFAARLGPLAARVEGSALQYHWTFTSDGTSNAMIDGATDRILMVSVLLGLTY